MSPFLLVAKGEGRSQQLEIRKYNWKKSKGRRRKGLPNYR